MTNVVRLDNGVRKDVELEDLIVWDDNPRIAKAINEEDAINKLFAEVGTIKMLDLMEDIAFKGLQSNEIAVCVFDDESSKYIVYDGNRRISALKAFFSPSIIKDELIVIQIQRLKTKVLPFEKPIISILSVTKEVAEELAFRKHGGKVTGASLQKWSPWQRDVALHNRGKQPIYQNAFDAVSTLKLKNAKELFSKYQVEYTDLERILSAQSVQSFINLHKSSLENVYKAILIKLSLIKDKSKQPLSRVFHSADTISIMIDTLQAELSDSNDDWGNFLPTSSIIYSGKTSVIKSTVQNIQKARRKKTVYADDLISSTYSHIVIDIDIYSNTVFDEITRVKAKDLKKFPNAFSALLRMFIDIAVSSFCAKKGSVLVKNPKLPDKIHCALTSIDDVDYIGMTTEQVRALKRFISTKLLNIVPQSGKVVYQNGQYLKDLHEMVHQGSIAKTIYTFTPEYNQYIIPFIIAMSNNLRRTGITN